MARQLGVTPGGRGTSAMPGRDRLITGTR